MIHQSLVTSGVTTDLVDLDNNLLSSQSEEFPTEIVSTCKMQHLFLSDNNFTEGLDLSSNSTLEQLCISLNEMSSRGASRLFSTLRNNKHNILLWNFDISNNNIGDEAVNDTTQFLMENNVFKHLHIDNNKFTEQGIIKILRSLHIATVLLLAYSLVNASIMIKCMQKRINYQRKHFYHFYLTMIIINYFWTCTIMFVMIIHKIIAH